MLHKRKVYAGDVVEIEYYNISDRVQNLRKAEPKERPARTPEEQEQVNRRQSLKRFVRLINEHFGPWALYVTLTFADEYLPQDFAEAKRIRKNYIRRLQTSNPNIKVAAVLGRGDMTGRIHMHMIVSGLDRQTITEKWGMGEVSKMEQLRENNVYDGIDCGRDYTGLATYMFDHWTKEQGGKRWMATMNMKKPEPDTPVPVVRMPSVVKPPKAPKGYRLIHSYESGCNVGVYFCFRYVREHRGEDIHYIDRRKPKNKAGHRTCIVQT